MLELSLAEIGGIHPDFARVERELNLAPIETPDRALMPESVMGLVTSIYPLVVSNQSGLFCIGKTALYRWLAAYADPQTRILCIPGPKRLTDTTLRQLVLIERLVAPALAQITPQQVRDLYVHIASSAELWPHDYRSHAHLARLVGVKPLKGREGEK
jgi:hypothetical protein